MQSDNEKLIKSTNNLSKEDINILREKFVVEYSRKKGWDNANLSPNQLLEIVEQKGYKNPGIILS
jgi:hypothetical protein